MTWVYDGENFSQIQRHLGPRPGGYRVDVFYLRRGIGNKPYFWNDFTSKWQRVQLGDVFFWDDETDRPYKTPPGKGVKSGQETRQPTR